MKQISGFSVIGINNGMRLTYTYDEINASGELISQNNRKSFYVVDNQTKTHIDAIFSMLEAKETEV